MKKSSGDTRHARVPILFVLEDRIIKSQFCSANIPHTAHGVTVWNPHCDFAVLVVPLELAAEHRRTMQPHPPDTTLSPESVHSVS